MKNPINSSFPEGFDCSLIYTVLSDTNPWIFKEQKLLQNCKQTYSYEMSILIIISTTTR